MRRRSSEIIPRPLLITLKTNSWSFKDRRNAMFMTRKGGHAPNLYAPVTSLRRMAVPIDSRGSQMLPLQAVCQASADGACTRRTDRARNILDVYKDSQHTLIKTPDMPFGMDWLPNRFWWCNLPRARCRSACPQSQSGESNHVWPRTARDWLARRPPSCLLSYQPRTLNEDSVGHTVTRLRRNHRDAKGTKIGGGSLCRHEIVKIDPAIRALIDVLAERDGLRSDGCGKTSRRWENSDMFARGTHVALEQYSQYAARTQSN